MPTPSSAHPSPPLGPGRIFRFWLPLAATWLMMAAEGPFLAALIARLPEPEYNLAAFGVSLSFALLLEAPVVMIMAAATALITDRDSLHRLQRFTWALNAVITAVMALSLVPVFFWPFATRVVGLPGPVAHLTYGSLCLLVPWPAAIGYRRLLQGVLIRHNLTRRVGYSTGIRLVTMALTAAGLYRLGVQGAYVAASALSAGVLVEAVACRWMAAQALGILRSAEPPPRGRRLGYRAIAAFYYPLALSSILTLGVHPIVSYFLAHAPAAVESLAVFPVLRSLVFLFTCLGLSYQEVGIALMGERGEGYVPLRRFAFGLGTATSLGLGVIAFSPLAEVWYLRVSGLTPELARYAYGPTRLLVLLPALVVSLSFMRSLYVAARRTGPVTWATVFDVLVIATVLQVATGPLQLVGVFAAALALLTGRCISNLWLWLPHRAMLRRLVDNPTGGPV